MSSITKNSADNVQVMTKKIKRSLEYWREIILILYDVLSWHEIPLHPALVFGTSTSTFLLIYLLDPTVISVVSFILLWVVLCDCLGLVLITRIFPDDLWNGSKEKQYHGICSTIASYYISFTTQFSEFYFTKETKPMMYYSMSLSVLILFVWIGSVVNTVFLTYLLTTFALFIPGLKRHRFFGEAAKQMKLLFVNVVDVLTSDKTKTR